MSGSDNCSVCNLLNRLVSYKDKNEKRLRYKYYARITERTERDLDLTGVWSYAGDYTTRLLPLKFCPACGKKVKWDGAHK